jgi:hypothetical protein
MDAPVKVGDVIHVGDADFCFGVGDLRLRVTEVGSVQGFHDGPWISLVGFELRADGSRVSSSTRHALVRVAALRPGRP